jgi:transposase
VDVSKQLLEVALLPSAGPASGLTVPNTAAGHKQLIRSLARAGGCSKLVLEATSNFNLDLAFALQAAGIPLCVINPRQASDFHKGLGRRAKTDRVDALVLAEAAQRLDLPCWTAPPLEALELRSILRRVRELTERGAAEKNRLHALRAAQALGTTVRRSVERQLKLLQQERALLLRTARQLVLDQPQLAADFRLLLTVKGIGELSALAILAETACLPPGLGCKQWVACAGLDPRPRDSGQSKPPRHLSRMGNRWLRLALFMPTLSAAHHTGPLQVYYQRLLARGKAKMVALCAASRKLLHAIWAILTYKQPFNPVAFLPEQP